MTRTSRSLQRMADWARLYFSAGAVVRAIEVVVTRGRKTCAGWGSTPGRS